MSNEEIRPRALPPALIEELERDCDTEACVDDLVEKLNEVIRSANRQLWRI